jgi:hypothetical protein
MFFNIIDQTFNGLGDFFVGKALIDAVKQFVGNVDQSHVIEIHQFVADQVTAVPLNKHDEALVLFH